jgi:hypothetical protein
VARSCFYCGSSATADDYGIPLWIPPLTGLADQPVEHMLADEPPPREPRGAADLLPYSLPSHAELGEEQPVARLHEAIDAAITERSRLALAEYSTRSLCAACAKWAADLDARARPLLEPMIEGGAREYDADEQRLLAAWAARAAYTVLAVERRSQGVPKSHRRALREKGEPHPNVFAGFGRYRANHIGVLAARLVVPLGEEEATRDVEAYSVLAVFGHLAVKVFGVTRMPAQTRVKPPEGQMVRFWPAEHERAAWPPLWGLSEQTLDSAFTYTPFFRPFRYTEVRYLGPGKKLKAKRRRTEGLRGRQ